jgi:hypothetical protein
MGDTNVCVPKLSPNCEAWHKPSMEGSCHCRAVRLEVARPPEWVGECNCSICRRTGGLWAYYRPDEVSVAPAGATRPYVWGDRTIALHHCRTCGCVTHWEALLPDLEKMGVNVRLFDGFDPASVELRKIDGASF